MSDLREEFIPVLEKEHRNFIENIIAEDLKSKKHEAIVTRFPPEPNGYLHIGHAKAICLNFGLSVANPNARCHLRLDDTNPEKEDMEYVEAIKKDVKWLGFDWKEHLYYASDYYDKLYEYAEGLIQKGLAYIDSQSAEEIASQRGNLKVPGTESPYRNRPAEESLQIFRDMKAGKYQEGEHVLRAKIDMSSGNMNMRDPVIYRIRYAHHYRTENKWCIYPMYDYAHSISDAEENITHSLCSLEFQDHRPLYDWCVQNTETKGTPRQIEFARLNLDYTVMSKRKLLQLVQEKHVEGWDDPRMPTLSGVRRRGYPAKAIRKFMEMIGIGKQDNVISLSVLEGCVRDELNASTKRCLAVLEPLKVTITNWDKEDQKIEAPFHPQDESFGSRTLNFGKELYIERSDWMDNPPSPKKWFRLGPERSVRLRYGYVITVKDVVRDENGNAIELKCVYHEDSFGGQQPAAVETKVKGIIHWVNANDAVDAQVRLYDRLFKTENPAASENFLDDLNPNSLEIINAKIEPFLANAKANDQFQFERMGYFTVDEKLSSHEKIVYNQTVSLKESWK